MRSRIVLFFLVLLLSIKIVGAQNFTPSFDHLSSTNGLSNNRVHAVMQDHMGFMWFGTFNGLCRYDGYEFVVYSNNSADRKSLGDSRITALVEGESGDIFVGTWDKGLNIYDRKSNGFIRYIHNPNDKSTISSNNIATIFIDSKKRVWIGTTNGGINLFNIESGTFECFTFRFNGISEQNGVYGISELPNGNLILATSGEGIEIFDPNSHEFLLYNNPNLYEDNFSGWEKSIFKDSEGLYWLTAQGSGVFSIDFKSNKVKQYKHKAFDLSSISSNLTKQIVEYGKGKYIVTTEGGGLNFLDSSTGVFRSFTHDYSDDRSISSNIVYSLCVDLNKNLWVGTFDGGVNFYNPNKNKFVTYKPNPADPNSLSNRSVLALFQDEAENIWIGTDGGGLNLYNQKLYGEKFIHFKNNPLDKSSISSNVVKSIYKDSQSTLWLGTFRAGLESFDPKTGRFTHHKDNLIAPYNKTPKSTWSIIEDDQSNIWFAHLDYGMDVLDLKRGTTRCYLEGDDPKGIPRCNVMVLYLDSKKRLWLGTEGGGLLRYERESDHFVKFLNDSTNSRSISSNDVRSIFEDSSGRIWFGTLAHGLNLLDESTNSFSLITEKDGLIGNSVFGILEDNHKNLWISTTKGISKFNYEAKSFHNYTNFDGLIDGDFNYGASLKAKDGRFYFGGLNGFNAFYPDSIVVNNQKPKVYITNLKLFNKDVVPGDSSKILKYSIAESKGITIAYSQSALTIQYTGISYTIPLKNRFAYKLEGFDKDWNIVNAKREATYTNLSPGEYLFRVKASNNDGVWNDEGASLKITVLPPYWSTWWFRILAFLIIGISLFLLARMRLRRYERHRKLLKLMVDNRTKELNQANTHLYHLNQELVEVNTLLGETNAEMFQQKEQLMMQNEEISLQKEELEKHRNHLKELVEERTNELITAKEKAEESDRLKTSFLANMSHEIRTPLNAIVGFSNLLTVQDNTPEESEAFAYHINRNTDDLLVLIDDILDFSALETKQSNRIDTVFNLNSFISDFHANWESHNKNDKLQIVLVNNVADLNFNFTTDVYKMRQILSNLMSNACKFTEQGSVTFTIDHKDGYFLFSVKDTGIGIASANLDIIFERFRKVEENRNKLFRGNGLGLAISLRLAELLGGDLCAESELGVGSVFYFSLPDEAVLLG